MTAILILFMFVAFVGMDFLVRTTLRRRREHRERQAREAVLNTSVKLDFTHEAKSLKRVEVPNPKARILAVDDEAVVLDSFRRILVLEGFSVDTVEHGPEALGLVQRRDYDFVFTDLKMPDMDGVEVVKAVKHLRPDVDVVVITGYGSIETAVQTLQQGACEYVQKPFTADELGEFAKKLLIKREARTEAARRPNVRVVSPEMAKFAVLMAPKYLSNIALLASPCAQKSVIESPSSRRSISPFFAISTKPKWRSPIRCWVCVNVAATFRRGGSSISSDSNFFKRVLAGD